MTVVARAGETIARTTTRRKFLQRASTMTFAAVAAWSVNVIRPDLAWACPCTNCERGTSCSPYGTCPYSHDCLSTASCNTTYCTYHHTPHSNTGCWCQATKCYNCGTQASYCGYWRCCDCNCENGKLCTCQGFHYTCQGCQTASPDCVPCC